MYSMSRRMVISNRTLVVRSDHEPAVSQGSTMNVLFNNSESNGKKILLF
jgi:hypothetical protein